MSSDFRSADDLPRSPALACGRCNQPADNICCRSWTAYPMGVKGMHSPRFREHILSTVLGARAIVISFSLTGRFSPCCTGLVRFTR
jgi:hypothetical protein